MSLQNNGEKHSRHPCACPENGAHRYFIVTGVSPEYLQDEIMPDIRLHLKARGLELSEEKTKLSHIDQGFNFLGFSVRKYNGRLLIWPQDGKPAASLTRVREQLGKLHGLPFQVVIMKLNRMLRGWAYAYRRSVAKRRMTWVDERVYGLMVNWLRREYRQQTWAKISKRYYPFVRGRHRFCASYKCAKGKVKSVQLFRTSDLPIRYHTKIRSEANPYDPAFREYFDERDRKRMRWLAIDREFLSRSAIERALARAMSIGNHMPGRELSAFEGLEPYDGKLSRTVLRGRRAVRP